MISNNTLVLYILSILLLLYLRVHCLKKKKKFVALTFYFSLKL